MTRFNRSFTNLGKHSDSLYWHSCYIYSHELWTMYYNGELITNYAYYKQCYTWHNPTCDLAVLTACQSWIHFKCWCVLILKNTEDGAYVGSKCSQYSERIEHNWASGYLKRTLTFVWKLYHKRITRFCSLSLSTLALVLMDHVYIQFAFHISQYIWIPKSGNNLSSKGYDRVNTIRKYLRVMRQYSYKYSKITNADRRLMGGNFLLNVKSNFVPLYGKEWIIIIFLCLIRWL